MSPLGGNRTGDDPSKLLSHVHPWIGRNKEKAGKSFFLVRKVFCPLLKIGKDRVFCNNVYMVIVGQGS
jgi:hypothetical protein